MSAVENSSLKRSPATRPLGISPQSAATVNEPSALAVGVVCASASRGGATPGSAAPGATASSAASST
ncbi:MAG: hypothetical protein OXE79_01875, partial [Acidimicrobiaceae bacterium]|nr:hypothetical protein [Acidimicrobiaceae bacterium]